MDYVEDRIDPQLRALLPVLPSVDVADPTGFREKQRARQAQLAATAGPLQGVTVVDRTVPGAADAPDVPIRVYTPEGEPAVRGVLVWFHGGGYVFGDIPSSDRSCAALAVGADCVVVSVEYRLAPEDPYPAGLDDAYSALVWVAENAAGIGTGPGGSAGIDVARIAVGGVSAGAGLAAALALYVRDKGGPELVLQLLDNPMIDNHVDTPSAQAFTDTPLWSGPQARLGWRCYLAKVGADGAEVPPYAAPSRATDLAGLPPAFVTANEFDPLRDEGIAYALRLLGAGVPVELHHRPGTFHGSNFLPGAEVSERARADMYAAVRGAFA